MRKLTNNEAGAGVGSVTLGTICSPPQRTWASLDALVVQPTIIGSRIFPQTLDELGQTGVKVGAKAEAEPGAYHAMPLS